VKIYAAGPLGFSEAGRAFYDTRVIPELSRLGHEVLDPWTLTDSRKIDAVRTMPYGEARRDAWRQLNVEIGVDVDSGTAAEIGYAFAKGKPIVGYRGDFRLSADNEGSIVNLQVEYFIRQSGGDIIAALADAGGALEKIGKP
jgi:nucleoside 2-deoxyribosyltransferase